MALTLNFREHGSGDPVVVLHGVYGSISNWNSIGKKMGDHFHMFLLDQRNHGESPHSDVMNYVAMCEDVREFILSQRLGQPHIIGHSMGGKVAMTLAAHYPELVSKLVVVDIAPVTYDHGHRQIISAMKNLQLDQVSSRQDADRLLAQSISDTATRNFLLANLVRIDNHFEWRINLDAIKNNIDILLDEPPLQNLAFAGESLFLFGERSDFYTPEASVAIAKHFPAAKIEHIPNSGHWVQAEQPALFLDAVEPFLIKN